MERRTKGTSRGEIQDTREQNRENLEESEERLTVVADDAEIVAETLGALEGEETSEGLEAVEQGIEGAADETEAEFDQETGELEQVQSEGEEFESELEGQSQSTESDLGKISDASGRINTEGAVNELITAKEGAIQDIEFFEDEISQSNEAIEESRRIQQEQEQRMQTARSPSS